MNAHNKREIMTIAKNSSISIGLAISILLVVFFFSRKLGAMETEMKFHEALEAHKGTKELFVPKGEVDLQFESVQRQLNDLKVGQKDITEKQEEILKAVKR